MSGVANPSPASALTALNIFNAVKLKKIIACINVLILTALIYILSTVHNLRPYFHQRKKRSQHSDIEPCAAPCLQAEECIRMRSCTVVNAR